MREVFPPRLSGFANSVQDGKELVHTGDQGDLLGLALVEQALIESLEHTVSAPPTGSHVDLGAFGLTDRKNTMLKTSFSPKTGRIIYSDLIVATVFVLLCSSLPALGKAFATLCAVPFVFWMIFRIFQVAHHAGDARKACLLRVGIWLSAFVLVFGILVLHDAYRRQQANTLVAKILEYQAKHGTCPPTLEIMGENLKARLGRRSVYICLEGLAHLSYTVPSSGFDTYFYDFERSTWNFHPD
jgi:hypothetical protein